jgi:hypothetical protein
MKPDAICIFIGPSISIFISGKPYLQAISKTRKGREMAGKKEDYTG